MKCKFCGKNVPTGDNYCSCGNPVSYDCNNNFNSSNNNFNPSNNNFNSQYSQSQPQSQILGTAQFTVQKQSSKAGKIFSIILSILLVIGIVGGGYFFNTGSYTSPKTYKTITEDEFTMQMPIVMADNPEVAKTLEDSIRCYTSKKSSISISKLTYDEFPEMKDYSIEELATALSMSETGGSIQKDGAITFFEFTNFVTTKNKNNYLIGTFVKGDDAIYLVETACLAEDRTELETYMKSWILSFKAN